MTTQQIVDRLILDNQNLVIEELMKHDECLWDELEKRKRDIFWDVEYAMLQTGIKYFNTCSEYWLYKMESEYIKAEKEYLNNAKYDNIKILKTKLQVNLDFQVNKAEI